MIETAGPTSPLRLWSVCPLSGGRQGVLSATVAEDGGRGGSLRDRLWREKERAHGDDPQAVAAAEPRLTTRTVTIPAVAFAPTNDAVDYYRRGTELRIESGSGTFTAPLSFEVPVVTIRKVTFCAVDAGSGNLILGLYRDQPAAEQTLQLGEVYTTGSSWSMQVVTLSNLSSRRITGAYGAFLSVYLPGTYPNGYKFIGAKVTCSY